MKLIEKEGKNLEEILEAIKKENKVEEKDFLYKTNFKKAGLFKGEIQQVKAVLLTDLQEYIKDFLGELLKNMGLDVNFETKLRDEQIIVKMHSDKNNILIGRNGQTLTALQTILRQAIFNKTEQYSYIVLDVENYKDKKNIHLERLAKNLAREVAQTGQEVKLDKMTSYERRIIHNILSQNKKVYTTSEGEEPNRYIVIKLKTDKDAK